VRVVCSFNLISLHSTKSSERSNIRGMKGGTLIIYFMIGKLALRLIGHYKYV